MKILHVIDSGGLYGAEIMLLGLMREQRKLGHTPVLCSINPKPALEKSVETKARDMGLDMEIVGMRPGLNLAGTAHLVKLGKALNADIFHSHGYKPNILLSLYPRKIRQVPLVSTIHGWTNTRAFSKLAAYEWLDSRLLKFKDAVVVVSPRLLEHVNIVSAKVDPGKLFVVVNGISAEPVTHEHHPSCEKINLFCSDSTVLVTVGRLAKEKGFNYLIEAFRELRNRQHTLKLLIIGDGPLKSSLCQQVENLGLEQHIFFPGYLDNARQYLNQCDVFVISSVTEGLPITLLEAMNEKVPAVCTAVGGIPAVLEHDIHGLLVASHDPIALADAIEKIIIDPGKALKYAENAHKLVSSKYSVSVMADAYDNIYRNVITG